jgi:sRNA-binding carbon storage regulator CsrA
MTRRTWAVLAGLLAACCGDEPRTLADISRDYCAILMTCKRPSVAIGYDDPAECEAHRAELYQKAAEDGDSACSQAQSAYETCVGELEWCAGFEAYGSGSACAAETEAWWSVCFGVTP